MSVHVKKQFWFFFSLRSYSASIIFRVQELHVSILIPETMILLFFVDQGFGKKKATCPQLETWGISLQDMEPLTRSYICCTGSCRWERLSVRDVNLTIIKQGCELVAMASDEGLFWSPTWPSDGRRVELGLTMQCKTKKTMQCKNVTNSPCLVPVVVWAKKVTKLMSKKTSHHKAVIPWRIFLAFESFFI